MFWKQKLVSLDPRLEQLVENSNSTTDEFDSSTFLYDLYKTSTVKEIEAFKQLLEKVQSETLETQMKQKICGRETDGTLNCLESS